MTDKELLEYAAKAAGIDPKLLDPPDLPEDYDCEQYLAWDPLTDDSDALRLAIKLKLNIEIYISEIVVISGACDLAVEKYGNGVNYNDPYAATRRAIVRAAAEIGKEMK